MKHGVHASAFGCLLYRASDGNARLENDGPYSRSRKDSKMSCYFPVVFAHGQLKHVQCAPLHVLPATVLCCTKHCLTESTFLVKCFLVSDSCLRRVSEISQLKGACFMVIILKLFAEYRPTVTFDL